MKIAITLEIERYDKNDKRIDAALISKLLHRDLNRDIAIKNGKTAQNVQYTDYGKMQLKKYEVIKK